MYHSTHTIYSPYNKIPLIFLLITILTIPSYSSPPCKDITLQSYKYPLSQLSHLSQINILSGSQFISLSLCQLISCKDSNNEYKTSYIFVKKNQTSCLPFTSNQTGPIYGQKQGYYKFIDSTVPSKGISIDYIPYYNNYMMQKNQTLILQNQTINYKNISQYQQTNYAKILLYCPNTVQYKNNSCYKSQVLIQTININSTYSIYKYQKYLTCELYLSQSCTELQINQFWQYLISKKIIFAIIFWITALYLILLGYLTIRITILLYGIFVGCLFGVIFIAQNYQNFYLSTNAIFIYIICISVVMGFLYGIFLLTLPKLGYINIGIFVSALFSLLLQNCVLYLTKSLLAFYITFGVCSLIMAIIALMQLRFFIICCTSFTGAFMFIRPLGFLLPGYPNQLISSKNFYINLKTPWQFYLYFSSIIVLTILGIIIQRCINKKMFRHSPLGNNNGYYLEGDGTLRDKLKKVFEFKEIKDLIKSGKKQFVQLKNMITDDSKIIGNVKYHEQDQQDQDSNARYIEMEKMQKIQNKNKQAKQKQRERERERERQKQRQRQRQKARNKGRDVRKKESEQVQPIDLYDGLEQIRDSDSIKPVKKNKNR